MPQHNALDCSQCCICVAWSTRYLPPTILIGISKLTSNCTIHWNLCFTAGKVHVTVIAVQWEVSTDFSHWLQVHPFQQVHYTTTVITDYRHHTISYTVIMNVSSSCFSAVIKLHHLWGYLYQASTVCFGLSKKLNIVAKWLALQSFMKAVWIPLCTVTDKHPIRT